MKVLLVDDEQITIKLLKNLIAWDDLGLEIAGTASDGVEALQLAVSVRPDIVITDIRMPNMDGLELIGKLNALSSHIKIIVMSAYADFSYVKEAMRMRCSNYILKPLDENELTMTLKKVIEEVNGTQHIQQAISRSEKELRMLALYQYMCHKKGREKILRLKHKYDFDFGRYVVLLIQKYNDSINEYVYAESMDLVRENYILSVIQEKLKSHYSGNYLEFTHNEEFYIFLLEEKAEHMTKLCAKVLGDVEAETKLHIQICFSMDGGSIEELPSLYEQVTDLAKYGYFMGDEPILGYNYNCEGNRITEMHRVGLLREAQRAIEEGDTVRLRDIFEEVFSYPAQFHPQTVDMIYEFCYRVMLTTEKYAKEKETGGREDDIFTYEKLKEYHSLNELKDKVYAVLNHMPGDRSDEKKKKYSKPVEKCIEIIETRYEQNLSLETISTEIAVSKNYFCYLFKRETGMSVWGYLTQVRMDYAKKLLRNTDLKSYEIAFKVGYDNPSYFAKIFKKSEGCTPNEYRDKAVGAK